MNIFNLFEFNEKLQIIDVGAAAINETPIYKNLFDLDLVHLYLFDGDERQMSKIRDTFGSQNVELFNNFLFDGKNHNIYICGSNSGMTSLYKPKKDALEFFNNFSKFGSVNSIEKIKTFRLDDIAKLNKIDFMKMDVQGAELEIIKNGKNILNECLAIQLEMSFFPLYEDQPSFGDVDIYLRSIGYIPHRFLDVKCWSISPTIFNGNFRTPGNQLLESDIVYIKDPLSKASLSDSQIKKLAILSHFCFKSIDLCVHLLIEMEARGLLEINSHKKYIENL